VRTPDSENKIFASEVVLGLPSLRDNSPNERPKFT